MSSDAFAQAWEYTGTAEGGYSDNPNDSGGPTNHGITQKVARAHGYTGDMRDLTPEIALEIAKKEYWDVLSLDGVAEVSVELAQELFDTGFNAGTRKAGTFLQRSLNALNRRGKEYDDIVVDGAPGEKTLNALRAYAAKRKVEGLHVLLVLLNSLQGAFYLELTERREKDEEFLYGWIKNRVVI